MTSWWLNLFGNCFKIVTDNHLVDDTEMIVLEPLFMYIFELRSVEQKWWPKCVRCGLEHGIRDSICKSPRPCDENPLETQTVATKRRKVKSNNNILNVQKLKKRFIKKVPKWNNVFHTNIWSNIRIQKQFWNNWNTPRYKSRWKKNIGDSERKKRLRWKYSCWEKKKIILQN